MGSSSLSSMMLGAALSGAVKGARLSHGIQANELANPKVLARNLRRLRSLTRSCGLRQWSRSERWERCWFWRRSRRRWWRGGGTFGKRRGSRDIVRDPKISRRRGLRFGLSRISWAGRTLTTTPRNKDRGNHAARHDSGSFGDTRQRTVFRRFNVGLVKEGD